MPFNKDGKYYPLLTKRTRAISKQLTAELKKLASTPQLTRSDYRKIINIAVSSDLILPASWEKCPSNWMAKIKPEYDYVEFALLVGDRYIAIGVNYDFLSNHTKPGNTLLKRWLQVLRGSK